jgi:uncharacterized protein
MFAEGGETLWLALIFLGVALVYASVGQAGASGYIAAMGLLGMAPLVMKTTALSLNLMVAGIGTFQFWRLGHLSWRTVYPFAILGFPFSLLGGAIQLPTGIYYPVVGIVLLLSAAQMFRSARRHDASSGHSLVPPPFIPSLLAGAVIGFVSGTTGTGGGVFLAPVILAMRWATARQTAATAAVYNLMNSGAALAGAHAYWDHIPPAIPVWLAAVATGGAAGAFLGGRYLSEVWMRRLLALLLLVSGLKLVIP